MTSELAEVQIDGAKQTIESVGAPIDGLNEFQSKPSESNGSKPSESNGSKPSESNGSKPSESNGSKPSESNGSKPVSNEPDGPKSSEITLAEENSKASVSSNGQFQLANADVALNFIPLDKISESTWKEVEHVGKSVVDLASVAKKEASAAVQDLTNKVASLPTITKLSSWWSSFDPYGESEYSKKEKSKSNVDSLTSDSKPSSSSHSQAANDLEVLAGESVIEAFSCSLLQTYKCSNNEFTPEISKNYKTSLHITEKRICLLVEDEENRYPIKLDHSSLKNVQKQKKKKENKETLKITLNDEKNLILQDFSKYEDLESAFALLEHLIHN